MGTLPNTPSFIEYSGYRFLIMDAPSDSNLYQYIQELKKYNVTHIVRLCDPTYSTVPLKNAGIIVHDWPFPDGDSPPDAIINHWLTLLKERFEMSAVPNETIAVHCVAGLGRAPVLVAIALIEKGMQALDSVAFIRSKRRGAINSRQLAYIEKYKPHKKLPSGKCIIL